MGLDAFLTRSVCYNTNDTRWFHRYTDKLGHSLFKMYLSRYIYGLRYIHTEGISLMIGKRIQQLRLARGLSLSELAERADIAKSYLSAIERNIQGNPSIQVIEKLASVLNVSIQALLGEESSDAPISLDPDWMNLAKEAMNSGVSKEQFREWLEFQRWRIDKEGK